MRARGWGALGAAIFLGGCAILSRGPGEDLFDASARDGGVVMIEVQNENFLDARIYAIWGPMRERIGTVVGRTTQTIRTDWRDNDLYLEVDFIAGGGFVSERWSIWPGETVILRIPPN